MRAGSVYPFFESCPLPVLNLYLRVSIVCPLSDIISLHWNCTAVASCKMGSLKGKPVPVIYVVQGTKLCLCCLDAFFLQTYTTTWLLIASKILILQKENIMQLIHRRIRTKIPRTFFPKAFIVFFSLADLGFTIKYVYLFDCLTFCYVHIQDQIHPWVNFVAFNIRYIRNDFGPECILFPRYWIHLLSRKKIWK